MNVSGADIASPRYRQLHASFGGKPAILLGPKPTFNQIEKEQWANYPHTPNTNFTKDNLKWIY